MTSSRVTKVPPRLLGNTWAAMWKPLPLMWLTSACSNCTSRSVFTRLYLRTK